jgi:hypothetical protein
LEPEEHPVHTTGDGRVGTHSLFHGSPRCFIATSG